MLNIIPNTALAFNKMHVSWLLMGVTNITISNSDNLSLFI